MLRLQKWQLLPAVVLALFLLALLRVDLRWRDCTSDEGRVCFNYPNYLPYEVRQAIDLHWLGVDWSSFPSQAMKSALA